jgi:hypothetical protein
MTTNGGEVGEGITLLFDASWVVRADELGETIGLKHRIANN